MQQQSMAWECQGLSPAGDGSGRQWRSCHPCPIDTDHVLGSWPQHGLAPATAGTWGVDQQMEDISLVSSSLSLCLPNKKKSAHTPH